MAKSLSQWWGGSEMEYYEDIEILLDISIPTCLFKLQIYLLFLYDSQDYRLELYLYLD